MTVRILPKARERLIEIWLYTEEAWGKEQADSYQRALLSHMEKLRVERMLWKPVTGRGFKGVFVTRCRHHFLFFRELKSGELGLLTVLHESMDLPRRLKEDLLP